MLCVQDFEDYAKKHLNKQSWIFYSQGAEREKTLKDNLRSFTRYRFVPRMLRNVSVRDLSTTILGEKVSLPIGIAPTGYQKLAHPDGEKAAAAAASEMGIIYTLSTVSTTSLEEVAGAMDQASPLWMQVYVLKERKYTVEMIRKAERSGYKALVLTVDTPVKGLQHRLWRDPLTLPPHVTVPNLADAVEENIKFGYYEHSYVDFFDDALTWKDVTWIKNVSKLPIVIKGILTVEDAVHAARLGAAAVWISNHGGRQLDGVDAAMDILPAISTALAGTGCEIYIDGGVRWGTDVLKALALGANAVFIGRPALWGLAHSGKEGVRKVLEILKTELDRAMHLAGCKDIQDIGPHLVKQNMACRL